MARSRTDQATGKVKFRFVEFELDGGDETIRESLKSIAASMMNGSKPKLVRSLPSAEVLTEEVSESEIEGSPDEPNDQQEARTAVKPSVARRPEVTKVKFLDELRFDDVSPTLREFCQQKNPTSDNRKYLVIAYWFKHFKGIKEVTVDHIYTAYRFMGWSTPKAAAQPLRDMRSKQAWFSKGEAKGGYVINHVGENEVTEAAK